MGIVVIARAHSQQLTASGKRIAGRADMRQKRDRKNARVRMDS